MPHPSAAAPGEPEAGTTAGALGHHSTDPDRGARPCLHLKPGSHDTAALTEVLEQMKVFYRSSRMVLVPDGLSAHWTRTIRA
ncbi:hypothetical protein [Streptomyces sp. 3211]|uniref:hypothetical protein n=1 Tax=Streptomyces sp. 3211 TaxID=1964449 RepID=UPI0017F3A232|nr:hypothetical protein [Streptomyces sp. 3211]